MPQSWAASSIDDDDTAWFWGGRTLTHVSYNKVLATYRSQLNTNTGAFVEPDHLGGAWLVQADPIEHIESSGRWTTYNLAANIIAFIGDGDRGYFSDSKYNRLGEFTQDGHVVYRDLGNRYATSLAVGQAGQLWFTAGNRNEVGVSSEDSREYLYPTHLRPCEIVAGSRNDFWFVEPSGGTQYLGHITSRGTLEETPLRLYAPLADVAVTPMGKIYLLEKDGVVAEFDELTQFATEYALLPRITGASFKVGEEGVYASGYGDIAFGKIAI